MIRIIIVLSIALFSLTSVAQQEITEGIVKAKMTMTSPNKKINMQLGMVGEVPMKYYIKDQKSRTEQNSMVLGNSVGIANNHTKELLILMDNYLGRGKKYDFKKIKYSKEGLENITVTRIDGTKTIVGYNCKGYHVKVSKGEKTTKMIIYTTDKIKAPTKNSLELGGKLKGFPMHTTIYIGDGNNTVVYTTIVTSVHTEKVDDSKFDMTIPDAFSKLEPQKTN